jgi:hypothetical protein
MSKVTVIAVEPCNTHRPGDEFDVSEREAEQLMAKGLVKMKAPHSNKMAAPLDNKANPTQAAGGARRSSASRAAQASLLTTASVSATGDKPKRKYTRRAK